MAKRLEEDCDACIAGRITGDGRREFYYYGRRPMNLHRLVEQELTNFRGYRFDCDTQPDPDWRQYLDVLYPTEENYELIKNMAVLEALGKLFCYIAVTNVRRTRSCQTKMISRSSTPFERTSKRRRGYPSETRVKRGFRVVHSEKELIEKLGRNDLCPCESGRRFQEVLPK